MKKIIALLLSFTLIACLFVGCAEGKTNKDEGDKGTTQASGETKGTENTEENGNTQASNLNVGVFYYNYADVYISSVRSALDAELDKAGVTYRNFDGNNVQATQNEQIQTAVTDGCNLLIVNMVTSNSSDTAKAIMEIAGDVPVIFFNRAIEDESATGTVLGAYDNICFIGTDAPEAGHLQGKMVGEYVLANYDAIDLNGDGVISYAMFKGDEANPEAIYRTQYGVEDANAILTKEGKPAMQYFDSKNTTGYQVDMGGAWSASAAMEYMNTNLAQFNETNKNMIELIICNNDNMAEGCISALNAAGYNNGEGSKTIPVFGVDATDSAQTLIAEGKMTGTVKQDAEGMAAAIASTAISVGEGKAMPEAVATAAQKGDIYSVAEGLSNKLFVAYAPYTAENK